MFRAYQSPASTADCGPQCAQIPNFASRNQSGILYARRDALEASNGPLAIEGRMPAWPGFPNANAAGPICNAGRPNARPFRRSLLENDIAGNFLQIYHNLPPAALYQKDFLLYKSDFFVP